MLKTTTKKAKTTTKNLSSRNKNLNKSNKKNISTISPLKSLPHRQLHSKSNKNISHLHDTINTPTQSLNISQKTQIDENDTIISQISQKITPQKLSHPLYQLTSRQYSTSPHTKPNLRANGGRSFTSSSQLNDPNLALTNLVSAQLEPEFPHPPQIPVSARNPTTLSRYKHECQVWATNPNCKATVKPSFTNFLYSNTFKTARDLVVDGKAREFEIWINNPQNKKQIDLNSQDFFGATFLTNASKKHYFGVVNTLLKHGADPNYPSINGPPLFHAVATLDMPIIRRLLEYGADINFQQSSYLPGPDEKLSRPIPQQNPAAPMKRSKLKALALMAQGNSTNDQTPLMVAASLENPAYALFLLENGADIERVDLNGRSALTYAARKSTPQICSILLERGANPHSKDNNGLTPLDYAMKRNGDEDGEKIVELLKAFSFLTKELTTTTTKKQGELKM